MARSTGVEITQAEWDAAHKNEVDRVRESMPTLDAKLLDSPEARYATLERLVRDRVLAAAAAQAEAGDQRSTPGARSAAECDDRRVCAGPTAQLDMERYRQLVGARA